MIYRNRRSVDFFGKPSSTIACIVSMGEITGKRRRRRIAQCEN